MGYMYLFPHLSTNKCQFKNKTKINALRHKRETFLDENCSVGYCDETLSSY